MSIKITELNKRSFGGNKYSRLGIQLDGDNINTSIVNSLRRSVMSNIPIYAICAKSINIESNTSIFDNDAMRLRLSQLPIFKIENNIVYLPNEYWKDVDYSNIKRERFIEDSNDLELYIDVTNDSNENWNF